MAPFSQKKPMCNSYFQVRSRDPTYLSSLGGPVTLVVHSKDAVLPVLLGLLTEYKMQVEFSKIVTHFCDLVTLAWGFRLDRLWLGINLL